MRRKVIEVMIVDHHRLMREGLTQLLRREPYIKIRTYAKNGIEAISRAVNYNPDVILLDSHMAGMNGIEVLKRFKDLGVESKVIIMAIDDNKNYLQEAMKNNARGYILKDSNSKSLIKAIRDVSQGKIFVDTRLSSSLIEDRDHMNEEIDEDQRKINRLTDREYEVLLLIAEGFTNKGIGEKLFISEKTVKNHIWSIFKKIEVRDRVKATIFVYETKIKEI